MHLDAGHRRNNFDFLRIVAALMVVFGHAYVLSGRNDLEPLVANTDMGGFGELGVSIFFVISGFLVTRSFAKVPNPASYFASRLLRILPALAVATLLTAFVLGPVMTSLPLGAYLGDPATWLYPVRNLLLYPVAYVLPGVFEDLPFPSIANGSLWTLRLEFSCYLLVPFLCWGGKLRPGLLGATAAGTALLYAASEFAGDRIPAPVLLGARFGYLFVAGAALYGWRDLAPLKNKALLVGSSLVVVAALALGRPGAVIATLVLPLTVIGFALHPLPGLSSWSRYGDYSYGVYIYAFPVQQALVQLMGPEVLTPGRFFFLALVCIAPLAAASWLLVEAPALELKASLRAKLQRASRLPEPTP